MKAKATEVEFLKEQTSRLEALGYLFGGQVTTAFGRDSEEAFLKAADNALLVTFREFRDLMERRNHSVDDLVDIFRGKIEEPREFFERVMSCRIKVGGRYEDRSDCVITYRSVVEFHRQELHYFKDVAKHYRTCACGCGMPIFGRQIYARSACRKRSERNRGDVTVEYGVRE